MLKVLSFSYCESCIRGGKKLRVIKDRSCLWGHLAKQTRRPKHGWIYL